MKIDSNAVVPIGWVLGGFGTIVSITVFGAFWVASVNFRLTRIEEKLGIPAYNAEFLNLIGNAFGESEVRCVKPKRLPGALQSIPAHQ